MALTRQGLAPTRTTHSAENLSAKGGYIAADADGERKATIIATGSEVEIALAARRRFRRTGSERQWFRCRVRNSSTRRTRRIANRCSGLNIRVAVEAAVKLGWDRYIGPKGGFVGMDGAVRLLRANSINTSALRHRRSKPPSGNSIRKRKWQCV